MLSGEALPELERRLDPLQEQAVAKLLEKVRKVAGWEFRAPPGKLGSSPCAWHIARPPLRLH